MQGLIEKLLKKINCSSDPFCWPADSYNTFNIMTPRQANTYKRFPAGGYLLESPNHISQL